MSSVYTQHSKFEPAFDTKRCAASVHSNYSFHPQQCKRKPVNYEEDQGWCKTHTPSLERQRNDERYKNYVDKLQQSPAVRITKVAARVNALEDAIDNYLASPRRKSDADSLELIRNLKWSEQ